MSPFDQGFLTRFVTGDTAGAPEQLQEMKFQQAGNQEPLRQANSVLCKRRELLRLQPLKPATLKAGTLKPWGSKIEPQNLL